MQTYRFTNTPNSASIDLANSLHLIPSGVRLYADRADFRARGGGDNPAPQNGTPKHWCYPGARWNFEAPGLWFVFLDGIELTSTALSNRETWGVLSQPNFYSTNAKHFPTLPKFRYQYVSNAELMRLSIGESNAANESPVPIAFLFEDPIGPIDWLTPDGVTNNSAVGPTGFKFRSTFPSDIGLRVAGAAAEAFRISEWTAPTSPAGSTFRGYSDAQQLEFLRSVVNAPGNDAILAAKIRAFFER